MVYGWLGSRVVASAPPAVPPLPWRVVSKGTSDPSVLAASASAVVDAAHSVL